MLTFAENPHDRYDSQNQTHDTLFEIRKRTNKLDSKNSQGDRTATISVEFPNEPLIREQETSASQVTASLGVILQDDAGDISLPEEIITPNAEQPRADTAPEIAYVQEKHMENETMQQDLDMRTAALSKTTFPKAGTGEAPGLRQMHACRALACPARAKVQKKPGRRYGPLPLFSVKHNNYPLPIA